MNNRTPFFLLVLSLIFTVPADVSHAASPWASESTYGSKTAGKLRFGLLNTTLGWTTMFIEAKQPKYRKDWEGFCYGISRSIFNTAAGLVQLATFPVPADFPDVGRGVHIPTPKAIEGGSPEYGKESAVDEALMAAAAQAASTPPVTQPSSEAVLP